MKEPQESVRINKYLASCGICSRREADRLILEGRVTVNGQRVDCGFKVTPNDNISLNGKPIRGADKKVVLAFYKPVGVTCSERDPHADKVINDIVKYPIRVTYAGRLDKDSEGLLLLTNDGDLINSIMKGANSHEKEYIVRVDKPVTDKMIQGFTQGVELKELSVKTRPAVCEVLSKFTFRIIITQGLNRQIRRMCQVYGANVLSLKRIRVVNITLDNLKPGEYRELTQEELEELYSHV